MEQPNQNPFVRIEVQPCAIYRFRYKKEREATGSIRGVNSTKENRTYPSIKVFNYVGTVLLRVSCVDQEWPYRPHPHRIIGRPHCSNGVYTIIKTITEAQREVEIQNIGIQCVRRKDVDASLEQRRGVDPFRTGFNGASTPSSFHHVRLAIEVLMPDQGKGYRMPMLPVVSDVITDRPTRLEIVHISHQTGSARGSEAGSGTPRLTMFTENLPSVSGVTMVRFFEESTDWEVEERPQQIHKRVGVVVVIPPYRDPDISHPVSVKLELCHRYAGREGEPTRSNSMSFMYLPEWAPGRDQRISSTFKPDTKRQVDEKQLYEMLHMDFDDSSPAQYDVESYDRDSKFQPWASQDEFDAAVAGTSQPRAECYGNFVEQTPQIGRCSQVEPCTQMGQSPRMQLPQMEYNISMNPPHSMERSNIVRTFSNTSTQHDVHSEPRTETRAASSEAADMAMQHYSQISELTPDDLAAIHNVLRLERGGGGYGYEWTDTDDLNDSLASMSTG